VSASREPRSPASSPATEHVKLRAMSPPSSSRGGTGMTANRSSVGKRIPAGPALTISSDAVPWLPAGALMTLSSSSPTFTRVAPPVSPPPAMPPPPPQFQRPPNPAPSARRALVPDPLALRFWVHLPHAGGPFVVESGSSTPANAPPRSSSGLQDIKERCPKLSRGFGLQWLTGGPDTTVVKPLSAESKSPSRLMPIP
jgi:hypothetical protein